MAFFEPDGILRLIGDVDFGEQWSYLFSSRDAQTSFFTSHSVMSFDDMSYMLHDGRIYLEVDPSVVKNCSYVMFQNPTQEGKWWYGRILDWKWVNTAPATEITYEIDWFQSYMFDFKFGICEIARETPSAAGWAKAMSNPFDFSVIEMGTSEPISIGDEDMEIPAAGSDFGNTVNPGSYIKWPNAQIGDQGILMLIMANGWKADLKLEELSEFNKTLLETGGQLSVPKSFANIPNALGYYTWPNTLETNIQPFLDLITLWGLTSEITGFYLVPTEIYNFINNPAGSTVQISIPKPKYRYHPKLSRFPFSYIRVTSPDGVSKEYKFENFYGTRSKGADAGLKCGCNISGIPLMYIMPMEYSFRGSNNLGERIEYADFPQIAYNTDAYLSFLNAQYSGAINSNNASMQMKRDFMQNSAWYTPMAEIGGIVGTVGGGIKGMAALTGLAGGNPGDAMLSSMYSLAQEQETQNVIDEAERFRTQAPSASGDSALSYAKPAYLADNYHPSGTSGYMPYVEDGVPKFRIAVMELTDTYAKQVARFLIRYGCASGRIGIPYCNNFNNIHWDSFDDEQITYCQTTRCEIMCNNTIARRYIEAMFNKGVVFVKGD